MSLNEYVVDGYTFKLTEEEAARRGGVLVSRGTAPEEKAAPAPRNKARTPRNKVKSDDDAADLL